MKKHPPSWPPDRMMAVISPAFPWRDWQAFHAGRGDRLANRSRRKRRNGSESHALPLPPPALFDSGWEDARPGRRR